MAVTKTSVVSVLVVLAITYNQGAAYPVDIGSFITNNGLSSSSEELQADSVGERTFKIPTVIKKGLAITLQGILNPNDTAFIVELPSASTENNCQIKLDYAEERIYITPAFEDLGSIAYPLNVTMQPPEELSFSLRVVAKVGSNADMFGITFFNKIIGETPQLICIINNFEDINQIVIKKGVAHVDSLLFEFESNH